MNDVWPCGHPRTEENTRRTKGYRDRCRECHNRLTREYQARIRAQAKAFREMQQKGAGANGSGITKRSGRERKGEVS